jgi:hypothetical protein
LYGGQSLEEHGQANNIDSKLVWHTRLRRDLEVRGVWRTLIALMPATIGAAIVTRSVASAIAGAVARASDCDPRVAPAQPPERARRRLLAVAIERVPDRDGWVTLIGVAGETSELLTAPYSRRPCIAYWARAVTADPENDSYDAGTDSEQRAASCDFALDVGDERVLVAANDAKLAFDRSLGGVVSFADDVLQVEPATNEHRGRDRNEAILLRPGERVIVRGQLMRARATRPIAHSDVVESAGDMLSDHDPTRCAVASPIDQSLSMRWTRR